MKYVLTKSTVAALLTIPLMSSPVIGEIFDVDDYPAIITGASEVSVRHGASTDSERAGYLKPTDTVLVVAHVNGWRQIQTSDSDTPLFVWSDFVAGQQLPIQSDSLKIRKYDFDQSIVRTQSESDFLEDEQQPISNGKKAWGAVEIAVDVGALLGKTSPDAIVLMAALEKAYELLINNNEAVLEQRTEDNAENKLTEH